MDPRQAKEWFGAVPPDLSVIARSRAGGNGTGADYLYTYLRSYYRDETKPTGWNNLVFPSVGMALNDGKIAEMRTGEGKTLTATLPVYLNALTDRKSTRLNSSH